MTDYSDLPEGATIIDSSNQFSDLPDGSTVAPNLPVNNGMLHLPKGGASVPINPSQDIVGNTLHQVGKGVPVLGNLLPDDSGTKDFEKEHPSLSEGANLAGAIGTYGPAAAGVAAATGPGLILNALGQTGLGAATSAADTGIKGGSTNDVENSALLGGLLGGAGSVGGKVLGLGKELPYDVAHALATFGGTIAALPHGLEAAVLGLLGGEQPVTAKILQKLSGVATSTTPTPTSKAVLNALGQKASENISQPQGQ